MHSVARLAILLNYANVVTDQLNLPQRGRYLAASKSPQIDATKSGPLKIQNLKGERTHLALLKIQNSTGIPPVSR